MRLTEVELLLNANNSSKILSFWWKLYHNFVASPTFIKATVGFEKYWKGLENLDIKISLRSFDTSNQLSQKDQSYVTDITAKVN